MEVHVKQYLGIQVLTVRFPTLSKRTLGDDGPCLPVYRGIPLYEANPE